MVLAAAMATPRQKSSCTTTIVASSRSHKPQTTPKPVFAIVLASRKEFSLRKNIKNINRACADSYSIRVIFWKYFQISIIPYH
jgi:hypothetical protein